jgi:hypothetical protein
MIEPTVAHFAGKIAAGAAFAAILIAGLLVTSSPGRAGNDK